MTTCKRTLAHIQRFQGDLKTTPYRSYQCGCEHRLVDSEGTRRWFLCSFHQGFEEAQLTISPDTERRNDMTNQEAEKIKADTALAYAQARLMNAQAAELERMAPLPDSDG